MDSVKLPGWRKMMIKNDRRTSGCTLRQKETWLNLIWASISISQHKSALISINKHQSASISTNQHQSAQISFNQKQSETISINKHQSASISINQHKARSVSVSQHQPVSVSINQHINQHSASIIICNWLGNYTSRHKCSKLLRSVRKL